MIVSRETSLKFETYLALLRKWQGAINLVSPDSLTDAGKRHIDDSLQLLDIIPSEIKRIADWGSGAGFPGMVIAIAAPEIDVHLVEADQRKCAFLRNVSRETNTPVTIHEARLEQMDPESVVPDAITARAFAPLERIFSYAMPWVRRNPGLRFFLLKGRSAEEEIVEAKRGFDFDLERYPSTTDPAAALLAVRNVREIF